MPVKGSRRPRLCGCGESNANHFYANHAGECKTCMRRRTSARQRGNTALHRARHLKRSYSWTPEKYDTELGKQHGLCALCGQPSIPNEVLRVDHDHETGIPRGLIHQHCNSLLGFARDNTDILLLSVAYLQRYRKLSD